MTAIKIDKNMCQVLRTELESAFEEIKKKTGVTLKAGNMSYAHDGSEASVKLTMLGASADGTVVSPEYKALVSVLYAFPFLNEDKIKREFKCDGQWFILTGFNNRARKNPFQGQCVDGASKGKSFVFPRDTIEAVFTNDKFLRN
ncbi:hypothetical protein I7Z51_002525 [Vibrio parahaemolyticus]|uniref:hypothetical protein n=1 Tax=Vibrio TaxID=662 RepID=UPI001A8F5D93|nr:MULTISPECIES: hypothetical protein [Vibrio]EGQ7973601.1 hypothetical protein [Vibrio parahaemolyticus]MBO0209808.1 hypothetical protein [Vibrio sp. Vb0877]MCR9811871.1 hypothetical protein [Vibrio parahaemolyticus]MDW2320269.1 hypothetical protein [Vibrio sp. 1159]